MRSVLRLPNKEDTMVWKWWAAKAISSTRCVYLYACRDAWMHVCMQIYMFVCVCWQDGPMLVHDLIIMACTRHAFPPTHCVLLVWVYRSCNQFIATRTNHRSDAWGGSYNNRIRSVGSSPEAAVGCLLIYILLPPPRASKYMYYI